MHRHACVCVVCVCVLCVCAWPCFFIHFSVSLASLLYPSCLVSSKLKRVNYFGILRGTYQPNILSCVDNIVKHQ